MKLAAFGNSEVSYFSELRNFIVFTSEKLQLPRSPYSCLPRSFVFVQFSPGGRSSLVMCTTPLPILKAASWQLPEGMWMRINRLVVWNHVSQNISTLQQFLTYLQGSCKPRAQSPKPACCRNEYNSAEHPTEQFPWEAS